MFNLKSIALQIIIITSITGGALYLFNSYVNSKVNSALLEQEKKFNQMQEEANKSYQEELDRIQEELNIIVDGLIEENNEINESLERRTQEIRRENRSLKNDAASDILKNTIRGLQ